MRVEREVGQVAQVGLSIDIGCHEVATHLASHHVLVGYLLQALENTEGVEHGVGLLVEFRVEYLTVGLCLEHIGAAGQQQSCCHNVKIEIFKN